MTRPPWTTQQRRVELRRARLEEHGQWRTYLFSFPGRRRPNFIRPEHMPEVDREADWDFAWYEVANAGEWKGLRRMARSSGDEEWTPESPPHAQTGGTVSRPASRASTPPGYFGSHAPT